MGESRLPLRQTAAWFNAVSRFVSCVLQSTIDLPYAAIKSNFADSINLLLHIERRNGLRYVSQALKVHGYDAGNDRFQLETIYERKE